MFHAFLHHKLDELIPEPQRREDALTSTVFGTLILVNAWDVLGLWLRVPNEQRGSRDCMLYNDCWFWPRLAFAEPDVVLRLGGYLVVVEAKFHSGRNDLMPTEDEGVDLRDQLVRQHRSIKEPVESRSRYAELLEQAIAQCQLVQVFIVDARRHRRARREWEESKRRLPPEANLRMVTWQDLFKVMNERALAKDRWATELRSYLQVCGLDTFEGVGRYLTNSKNTTVIRQWREPDDHGRWQKVVAEDVIVWKPARLKYWRLHSKDSSSDRWGQSLPPKRLESARNAITAWRVNPFDHLQQSVIQVRRRNL